MKLMLLLICLSLSLARIATAAPGEPAIAADEKTLPVLWLTVKFNKGVPLPTIPPEAEVSTLITANAHFQQQFTWPQGSYGIAGVLGTVSGDQYPLWIRLSDSLGELWEMHLSLKLDQGDSWAFYGGRHRGQSYTVILSHAPEWHEPTKSLNLTDPDSSAAGKGPLSEKENIPAVEQDKHEVKP